MQASANTYSKNRFVDKYLWVMCAAVAAFGFLLIWTLLPHEREVLDKWQFAVKIGVFVFAIAAVSTFPNNLRYGYLLASLPFLVFLGFIIPRMTYYFLMGPENEPAYYTYLWSLSYPGIILSICFGYRMGGGLPGKAIKLGLNGLILVFSGYLELMWFIVNPLNYSDMPSIPHVEVVIGFMPSYFGLFIFALCHIPLLVGVNLLPLDRWYEELAERKTVTSGVNVYE